MTKQANHKKDEFESVQEALSTSEAFIEKNQKQLLIGVGVIVLLALIVMSVRNFYLAPRATTAANEMYKAQTYFATDSFRLALNGDETGCMGFDAIASEYSMTPSGNLASAYAGICCYKLDDYQGAIMHLSQFDGDDTYLSTAVIGLTGDCYVAMGETAKAVGYFEKAAGMDNDVLSPVYLKKAGLAYEAENQPAKAEKCYRTIKESYARSQEAADIDKYIARVAR